MSKEFKGSVWQDGMEVAGVSAPDRESLMAELWHYALVYGKDGPVTLKFEDEETFDRIKERSVGL